MTDEVLAKICHEWDEFPDQFGTIVMDPPWEYRNRRTGGSMSSGASQKYPCLSLEQLQALPMKGLSQKDSVLFLWTTQNFMEAAYGLLREWGFQRRTVIVWAKPGPLGMGFWLRNQCEFCLVATRGRIKPFRSSQRNLIVSPRKNHSQKPEEFWQLLQGLPLPSPRVELFAREARPGWYAWGNEL